MAESDFIVKNGIVVNGAFTANSTLVNAAAINVSGQVNVATLFASTSANVGSNVQITTSQTFIGNSTSNNIANSSTIRLANSTNTATLSATSLTIGASTINTTAIGIGATTVNSSLINVTSVNVTGALNAANLTSTTNTSTFGTAVYVVSNGNLGVGTNVPSVRLAISSPANTHTLQIGGNAQGNLPGPTFGGTVSYNFLSGFRDLGFWNGDAASTTAFAFYQLTGATTYSNLMFISANGNVGIGTSASPLTSRLTVSGTANITGNTIIGGGLTAANLTSTTNTVSLGTTLFVVAGGNVGISNSTPDAKLTITGTANISANVAIGGVLTLGNSSVNAVMSAIGFSGLGLEPAQLPRAIDLGTAAFVDIDAMQYTRVALASSAYSLTLDDNGKLLNITTGGVTVNGAVLPVGFNVQIFNNSSANQTITSGAGVTMYQAGTANTGNRTILQRGLARIACVANNIFVISGSID